jgi:hypothetical protein
MFAAQQNELKQMKVGLYCVIEAVIILSLGYGKCYHIFPPLFKFNVFVWFPDLGSHGTE